MVHLKLAVHLIGDFGHIFEVIETPETFDYLLEVATIVKIVLTVVVFFEEFQEQARNLVRG